MFIRLFFVVLLALPASYAAARLGGKVMGGWEDIANPSADGPLLNSARFAAEQKHTAARVQSIKVLSAKRQVVAGMKFDMLTQVTLKDGDAASCVVDHYEVWDRFGERTVQVSETTSQACQ